MHNSGLDSRNAYYRSKWFPRCNMNSYQSEMEDAFRIDCNPEDVKQFPEAKKCLSMILKSRKHVNKIVNLSRRVFHDD